MNAPRRLPAVLVLVLSALSALALSAPPAGADDAPGGGDNAAVAVNTDDGASLFRLAFSVRIVANGAVDETNSAYALASCTDCQTVALAFQVVLVTNNANVVVPENTAVAYNDQCVECVTYASATQIVLGFDGPVRFTSDGRQRLAALYKSLSDLEDTVGQLSLVELNAVVGAAKAELVAILQEELVPEGQAANTADASTSTSPTAPAVSTQATSAPTTATTSDGATTTTSTTPPSTVASTTSTTAGATTTSSTVSTTSTTSTTAPTSTTVAG